MRSILLLLVLGFIHAFQSHSQEKSMPLLLDVIKLYQSQSLKKASIYFKNNEWKISEKLVSDAPEQELKEFEYTKNNERLWFAIEKKKIVRILLYPTSKQEVFLMENQLQNKMNFERYKSSSEKNLNLTISKNTYRKNSIEVKILSVEDDRGRPTKYMIFIADKESKTTGDP